MRPSSWTKPRSVDEDVNDVTDERLRGNGGGGEMVDRCRRHYTTSMLTVQIKTMTAYPPYGKKNTGQNVKGNVT